MTVPIPENVDTLVEQYVRLRDKIKEAEEAHRQRIAPAKEHLDKLGAALLAKLAAMGGESVKTEHGTAYKTVRRSATIADGAVFRAYVIENAAYDLADWRANATAVSDFIQTHKGPPPGVNYSTLVEIGVRRPTGGK